MTPRRKRCRHVSSWLAASSTLTQVNGSPFAGRSCRHRSDVRYRTLVAAAVIIDASRRKSRRARCASQLALSQSGDDDRADVHGHFLHRVCLVELDAAARCFTSATACLQTLLTDHGHEGERDRSRDLISGGRPCRAGVPAQSPVAGRASSAALIRYGIIRHSALATRQRSERLGTAGVLVSGFLAGPGVERTRSPS